MSTHAARVCGDVSPKNKTLLISIVKGPPAGSETPVQVLAESAPSVECNFLKAQTQMEHGFDCIFMIVLDLKHFTLDLAL